MVTLTLFYGSLKRFKLVLRVAKNFEKNAVLQKGSQIIIRKVKMRQVGDLS